MNATTAVATLVGDKIHTGTMRMSRRNWTTLIFAVESAIAAERKELAHCRSINVYQNTLALIERRIERLVEVLAQLDAASIQIATECKSVAALADDEVTP